MNIGIIIGSFNPPHLGHHLMAIDTIKANLVDKIIFVPANNYYQKEDLIDSNHRYNMLNLMIKNNKNIFVSNVEISVNQQVYTYQTLNNLNDKYNNDNLYLIIGADNLVSFNKWKNYQEILSKYHLIIFKRDDIDVYKIINKEYYEFKHKFSVRDLDTKISSSLIREKLIKNEDVSDLLESNVIEYIKKNKLYQD